MKNKTIVYIAFFTALTGIGAQIAIPIGTVPVTLQLFFVFLSGFFLGPVYGMGSQLIYILMGALGFPVFANFTSGMGIVFGPTGGFLLAFPLASLFCGYAIRAKRAFAASLSALGIIYIMGWLRLSIFTGDLLSAFLAGVLPFVAFDFLKLMGAVLVYSKVLKLRTSEAK